MKQKLIESIRSMHAKPCVSIFMPTHRQAVPSGSQDRIRLGNLLKTASQKLHKILDKREARNLVERLEDIESSFDYHHFKDGLAIFLSPDFESVHRLPFAVEERVVVGDKFALAEIMRAANRSNAYGLLLITGEKAQFLLGKGKVIEETTECGFPMNLIEDEPADQRIISSSLNHHSWYPARTRGPSGDAPLPGCYAPDESQHIQKQKQQFFRRVHAACHDLFKNYKIPLVICAVQELAAALESELSRSNLYPLAVLPGSHEKTARSTLGELAWSQIRDAMKSRSQEKLRVFMESLGEKRSASGIEEVWKNCRIYPAEVLLVEKGFTGQASDLQGSNYSGAGEAQAETDFDEPGRNLLDESIAYVLDQGGEVIFTEPESLTQHGRVAAIFRY